VYDDALGSEEIPEVAVPVGVVTAETLVKVEETDVEVDKGLGLAE
jgi:hypothetical protein